jgi:hypothetical protein
MFTFANLGLDSILPHGEVLLTLLFPLRLQRKLQDRQRKISGIYNLITKEKSLGRNMASNFRYKGQPQV